MRINYTPQQYEQLALNSARVIVYIEGKQDRLLALQIMRDQGLPPEVHRQLAIKRREYARQELRCARVFAVYMGRKNYALRRNWLDIRARLSTIRQQAIDLYQHSFYETPRK